jgi:hypothetical protein
VLASTFGPDFHKQPISTLPHQPPPLDYLAFLIQWPSAPPPFFSMDANHWSPLVPHSSNSES